MLKAKDDFKLSSHGEGWYNRWLDWLEIHVTRWNRKKQVFYISNKYLFFYFGSVLGLAFLAVFFIVAGAFTGNPLFVHTLPLVLIVPASFIEIVGFLIFLVLICFRRVRFTNSNLTTILPSKVETDNKC